MEIWLGYFIIRHYCCLWYFLCSASKGAYTLAKICTRHYTLENLRQNTSRECSRKCFRDFVSLILWKLSLNACMREFWARQGLIHGMLLRSLASFIRCDDTLVHFGSGKSNVGKLKLLFELLYFILSSSNLNWSFIRLWSYCTFNLSSSIVGSSIATSD